MDRRRWLEAGVSIAGTIVLAAVLPVVIQLVAAILLLLLPGYAVSLALLPNRELRLSELVTVILAAGVASLAVGGLLVTNLPSRVSAEAWVGLTAVLVAAGVLVADFRHRPLHRFSGRLSGASALVTLVALGIAGGALAIARTGAVTQDSQQTFSERVGLTAVLVAAGVLVAVFRRRPPLPRLAVGRASGASVLVTLVALGIAGGALAVARAGAETQDSQQTFSELWAVPQADGMLHIGLTSHEQDASTYLVDVELDGKVIAQWPGIALSPGAAWETVMRTSIVPDGGTLQILAFIDGAKTPYRSVVLHGSPP
jgi:hypothetical protein